MATSVPKLANMESNSNTTRLWTECGREFQSRSGFGRHVTQTTIPIPYCGKMFFDKDKLKMNIYC
ncbi:hypothetical protein DPMN_086144 [Dreissena polymorpha]|uniref:Uncharacterized protein n=1 Tax=Dreissena polymorpha TaxID=45954 RepID=A0A9D4BDF7_DREPO|nr:hypothetical protein DPMN_086144 [Dreissena polymorpha]